MGTFALTSEETSKFDTSGYLLIEGVIDAAKIERANRAFEEIAARSAGQERPDCLEWEPASDGGPRRVRRVYNPVENHEAFRELALCPEVLDRVESLIGPNLQLQHSKLNAKEARVGSGADWHQDLAYIPHTNSDLVAVLIHLEDSRVENGCIQVIPGAHKGGILAHSVQNDVFAGLITDLDLRSQVHRAVICEANAGSALFVHCLTPHASSANQSSRSRRLLILQYRAADAYPIYFGSQIHYVEPFTRQVRGRAAPSARFAFSHLPIPQMQGHSSLFDLQARHATDWKVSGR